MASITVVDGIDVSALRLLLAAIEATADLVIGDSWSEMSQWLQLAAAFDLVFVVVSAVIFQFILED